MRISIFLFYLLVIYTKANAQSVVIGNPLHIADSSAILDIGSVNKGVLLPRIFLTSKMDTSTIRKPAVSLLVYNTNKALPGGTGYYVWNGLSWDLLISTGNVYVKGKNRYTIMVDSVEREYWVHVPTDYDSTLATPLVFMLHGTGWNGEKMYDKSGWKELGEEEGFISVFPSSMRYNFIEDSISKRTAKWNITPDADWVLAPGENGKDDIKFLRELVKDLRNKFKIDTNRVYMNGFSNGGSMAAKCAVEMGDVFAAVASNASSFHLNDTTYTPVRKLPVLFQVGNEDYGAGNTGPTVPLVFFDTLISSPGLISGRYYNYAKRYIRHFSLDSNYTLSGDTGSAMVATYQSLTPGDTLNIFKYIFVKGLGHKYPNEENHWFDAPRTHWAWLRQYRKP